MKKFVVLLVCLLVTGGAFAAGENIATSKAYVDTAVAQKQDAIPANDGVAQVLTNTGTPGSVGTKNIYDASGEYATQTGALVTAGDFNTAVQNAVDNEFECIQYNPNDPTDCWLVQMRAVVEQSMLSSGYTPLEYIESTGTQYINTGIMTSGPGLSTEVKLELTTNSKAEQAIIGCANGGRYEVYFHGEEIGLYHNNGETWQGAVFVAQYYPNVIYTLKGKMTDSSITQEINGVQSSYTGVISQLSEAEVTLFRHNSRYAMSAKAYYVKIWQNDILVRNFIPARRDSDGVLGMYDTISNTFFTNAGTGEFIAGPVTGRYIPSGN